MTISDTLAQRGPRYGAFLPQSQVSDHLQQIMSVADNWRTLAADQRDALRMISVKISRILTGDPNYDDNWRDIAGYAQLILNRLTAEPGPAETKPAEPAPTRITWSKGEPPSRMVEKITANGGKATQTYDGTGRVALYCSPDGTSGIVFLEPGDTAVKDSDGVWSVAGPDPDPEPEPEPPTQPRLTFTFTDTDTADTVANWINAHGEEAEPDGADTVLVYCWPENRDALVFRRGQTIRRTRKGNWKIT